MLLNPVLGDEPLPVVARAGREGILKRDELERKHRRHRVDVAGALIQPVTSKSLLKQIEPGELEAGKAYLSPSLWSALPLPLMSLWRSQVST